MKKISRREFLKAAGLAGTAAAALALTGCGASSSSSVAASSVAGAASAGAAETAGPATISFMLPTYYGTALKNTGSDQVIAAYEAYTNTTVNWSWEANDTYNDKLGLTLMDKENMPMILTASGSLNANIIDAAKKGAFWDLSPYLDDAESYPNLAKSNKGVLKALTVDGQVIGIYRARAIGRYGFAYRTDWAEKVGITSAPKTIDDVYDMLVKFTKDDPDGDGKNNTYGLEMCKYTGPLDIMQTWFGVGNGWVEKDGGLVPVHQTAEYMEALKWLRKIYEEGLVRKDWATVDTATWSDGCKKGEAGVFIDTMDGAKRIWNYYTDNTVPSVVDASKTATMTMVGAINGKTLATSGFNGFYLITKWGAKTEEDLKNCLHFLDKMNDNEMRLLADYGIEGISYTVENGHVVLTPGMESSQMPNSDLNQCVAYIPTQDNDPTVEKRESQVAADACQVENEKVAVLNPALGYLANSDINAEVGTDIAQIIDDARTQYICGQIDDKGLEAAFKQWADRGGADLVAELNEMYKADN